MQVGDEFPVAQTGRDCSRQRRDAMRMPRFASLRANIIGVVVLASSLAVGLFTVLITLVNTRSSIGLQDSRLAVLADVIGQNSTAALDFSDHKAAAEVLEALRREPPVVSACLYDARGVVFSEYQRSAGIAPCPKHFRTASIVETDFRQVTRSIRRDTEFVGSIEVTADMRELNYRNNHILVIAIGLALISLSLAASSGALLQRRISRPVIQLAAAMNRVTKDGTFEARVSVEGAREIAQLAAGFNRMVTELERRSQIARAAESQLLEQARTDELTGLPNRRYLLERLPNELERAKREAWRVALLYIDLDGFKLVNDSLGHGVGDLLLRAVANRLKSRVRLTDTLARVGGDEFTVILTGIESPEDATVAANGLIQSLSRPFVIEGNEITVGASIGISTRISSGMEDPDL